MSEDRERQRFEGPQGAPLWLRLCPAPVRGDPTLQALGEVLADPETERELEEGERSEAYPEAVLARLRAAGLARLYAGTGATAYHQAALCVLAAQRDTSLAITLGVNSLALLPTYLGASPEQLAAILACVEDGASCSLLLTELEAGSNLLANEARAEPGVLEEGAFAPVDDEARATHYRLSGDKQLINGGVRHRLLFAFLRTQAPTDDPVAARSAHGLFWLERQDGVHSLRRWPTLPARAADISGVRFEDVLVPVSQRFGGPGEGFEQVQRALSISRGGIAALAVGTLSRARALAFSYARRREVYGAPITTLGAITDHLMVLDASHRVATAVSLRAMAWVNASGVQAAPYTAVAKLVACDLAEEGVDAGRRVLGGRALLRDLPYEGVIRDVLLYSVFDGTSHLMAEDLQMRLSMETRRRVTDADTVATLHAVYGAEPRVLSTALRDSGGPRPVSLRVHSRNLAKLPGVSLIPLVGAADALLGLTAKLKEERRWGDDQGLRHDLARSYALLEALCALVELCDPDRRPALMAHAESQSADGLGYRFALGWLGARVCAQLAARAAKAGVADTWDLDGIGRRFLAGHDAVRRDLARVLVS